MALLSPLHPAFEVFRLYLVAVYELSAKLAVGLVEIETEGTAEQREHFIDILAQLLDVAGASRIVARSLNAAGSSLSPVEADDIVGLPAMQADGCMLERFQGFVSVYTEGCIALAGDLIVLLDLFRCPIGLYLFG